MKFYFKKDLICLVTTYLTYVRTNEFTIYHLALLIPISPGHEGWLHDVLIIKLYFQSKY